MVDATATDPPRSLEYPSRDHARGLNLIEWLHFQPSFQELQVAVQELTDDDLRHVAIAGTAAFQQQAKSPDDYAAWWKDPER